MKDGKIGALGLLVFTLTACHSEPTVQTQTITVPAKLTERETRLAAHRDAMATIEVAARKRGVAWRLDLAGADGDVLVFRRMRIGLSADLAADTCTRKEFPDLVNKGLQDKASQADIDAWLAPFRAFSRVECDTDGGTVVALVLDAKTKTWSVDPSVPDLAAKIRANANAAAQAAARSQRPRSVEIEADDPDRYMYTGQ